MSEVTYIKCDGVGCEATVLLGCEENEGWSKDDMDADFCPTCQKAAEDLEESTAGGEDLAVFGETLTKTADAVLESPEVLKMKADHLAAYEKLKKDSLKAIRKEMKAKGLAEEQIKDTLDDVEKELDETYNNKFNFKAEA